MRVPFAFKLMTPAIGTVQVAAWTKEDKSDAVLSRPVTLDSDNTAIGYFDKLEPATTYRINVAFGGSIVVAGHATYRTPAGANTPESFGVVVGSCNDTGTSAPAHYAALKRLRSGEAQGIIHTGDLHYGNVGGAEPADRTVAKLRQMFDYNLRSAGQRFLYGFGFFMWFYDDHDGIVGAQIDSATPALDVLHEFYRGRVPPQNYARSSGPPYYEGIRGRCSILMLDCRSERTARLSTDNASKVVLSREQDAWFKDSCMTAKAAGRYIWPIITWPTVSVVTTSDLDVWGQYSTYRASLGAWINDNGVRNRMFAIEGDAHYLAFILGLSAENVLGIPTGVFAPWYKDPNGSKGGPYDDGPLPGGGGSEFVSQYGLIQVTDTGGPTVNVRARGFMCDTTTWDETTGFDRTFTLQAA